MKTLNIGLVGCGAIGGYLAREIECHPDKWRLIALFDSLPANAKALQANLSSSPEILELDSLVKKVDVIVEAASVSAVPPIIELASQLQKKVVIISVGAFLLYPEIHSQVKESQIEVFLPSGALAGLDALKSACQDEIEQVRLFTRKPLKSISDSPYLQEQGIDLAKIDSPSIIFQGNASKAVAAFPKNINVAAAVSLAGIGPEKTEVIIEVSPTYTTNSHELIVKGAFGSFRAKTENLAFPGNPKTSFLAALSTLETISRLSDPLKVGN